jgi:hypothetical protein
MALAPPARWSFRVTGPEDWKRTLDFYDRLAAEPGWEHLSAFRQWLDRLVSSRSADGFAVYTAHAVLCLADADVYPAMVEGPRLCILPGPAGARLVIEHAGPDAPADQAFPYGEELLVEVPRRMAWLKANHGSTRP